MAKPLGLVLLAAALLSLGAIAWSQRAADAEERCFASGGHADARECLTKRAAGAAARLKAAELELRSALSKSDQEQDEIGQAIAAFDVASKQYQRYRKDQCDFVAALAFGGNGAGDRRLLCQVELDSRRIADLANERHRGL